MTTHSDMCRTTKLPAITMAELVYGPPKRARVRLPHRLIFVAALLSTIGCATGRPPAADAPESVGTLAPSYASIATAPIHHDAPPEFAGIVDTGSDDATDTLTTVTRAPDAGRAGDAAPVEAPAPVEKVAHGF